MPIEAVPIVSPGAVSTTTLNILRQAVRAWAKNAKDSSEYPDFQIDSAIVAAAERQLRITRATRTLTALALTAGSNVVPALPAGFLPEFALQTFLTLAGQIIDPSFTLASYEQVLAGQFGPPETWAFPAAGGGGTSVTSGQPKFGGFIDTANAIVYPTPDKAYVIQLWWFAPFTAWTLGAQGTWSAASTYQPGDVVALAGTLYQCVAASTNNSPPNSTYWLSLGAGTVENPLTLTFNIPDDHLRSIGRWGGPGLLQLGEDEKGKAAEKFLALFDADAKAFAARGAGGRGGKTSTKSAPE